MRQCAMVFDDREWVARENIGENVDVRSDRAEDCGKNRHSMLALRKKSLADKRACNAVRYWIHVGSERRVYTIRFVQAISIRGERLATASPMSRAGMPRRSNAAIALDADSGARAASNPPEV